RRQVARSARDHRLNVLRRGIDVSAQHKLQGDLGAAQSAGRAHRVEAGDGREIFLKRGSDRRRHVFRAGPRQVGAHCDGREVNGRKIAYRQRFVAQNAEDQYPQHHQGGGDRSANEDPGDIHESPPSDPLPLPLIAGSPLRSVVSVASLTSFFMSTLAPGPSTSCPSRTTCSPGCSPLAIIASPSLVRATVTGRTSPLLSAFTTNTCCPSGPTCTASDGMTTPSAWVLRVSATLIYWPGHKRRSLLLNSAFSLIVPVERSTALSTKVRLPSSGCPSSEGNAAFTLSWPAAMCRLMSTKFCSGTEKVTLTGVS